MPVEVEAKIKVDSHDAVRRRLATMRAMRISRVLETNHIFDSPERTLLCEGRGLRIRICRAVDGYDPPATLTYKGPRIQGPLKTREEIEVSIDDGESGKYKEFKGNVATVYTNPLSMGGSSNGHYGGNAETYMNVGEAMGKAMVELLRKDDSSSR